MIFRQLVDARSSTYTYLLADPATREAVLIDPVFEQFARDAALVRELRLALRYTLETHVHADHVTAAWLFHERLGSAIVVSAAAGVEGADRLVGEGDVVTFGGQALSVLSTPGHTGGCVSYLTGDRQAVFTGDSLMIRGAGRTDFQQGDAHRMYRSVRDKLFALPDDCAVYPAHDYAGRLASSIGEERGLNPRLGGARSEADFVGFMANLGLAHPKQLDVALPANLRCGRPLDGAAGEPEWAPAQRSFAGVLEVEAEWLAEHAGEVQVVDVREPAEWNGELGRIPGARHLPLGELRARLGELARARPVVAVCRSGGRSAEASLILEQAGFPRSANLAGGMIRWHELRLPTESGAGG
ncbi:MAG TPA: MBL fold metallo-hydrolase [Polyangia bacterium]|jgi:glyoxylase-like metal-dependent hydrolase (beta-lactamase superfamily II)/rhodanese-related sulfurtransferase